MAYEAFKPMIHFFGDEAYKVISGNDFMKEIKFGAGRTGSEAVTHTHHDRRAVGCVPSV